MTSKIPVTFTTMWDLYITDRIRHVPSGLAVGDGVVLQNSEVDTELLTEGVQEECAAAWEAGNAHLNAFVRRRLFPVGRAEATWPWSVDDGGY